MNDLLNDHSARLVRLAATIRDGLDVAERSIPLINHNLARLAELGVTNIQLDGPSIYCRPQGVSSQYDDEFILYRSALLMPGGIGATVWTSTEYAEYANRPYGEPVDLAPMFVGYERCPPVVRAMLLSHAGRLLESLMSDVRILGS